MKRKIKCILACFICTLIITPLHAQERSLAQDPSLNNLQHPDGYVTTEMNKLGDITKLGSGEKTMIFVPGINFGAESYLEFLKVFEEDFTIYAVTLPGFGGTSALPIEESPDFDFDKTPWINSAINGIESLIKDEELNDIVLASHWMLGSHISLELAIRNPDVFDQVILIGGVAKSYFSNVPGMLSWTPAQRKGYVGAMAGRWFKTVTRKTWDDNNYMTYDYAVHPLRGLFLWREAATPSLAVHIRYMLEFYTTDVTSEFENLKVPVLVLQPDFEDPAFYVDPTRPNYMKNMTADSWQGIEHPLITFERVEKTRLFMMYDKPDEVNKIIRSFIFGSD